ncbi:hypothetical protein GCM10020220_115900 [Nonomuraea rubra]
MLLILSEPGDTTVRMVLPKLKARGAEVVWWDPAQYPAAAHLTARFRGGRDRAEAGHRRGGRGSRRDDGRVEPAPRAARRRPGRHGR